MTRTLLIRGMLVGLLAGVLAFGIARVLGEGPLSAGITFETATEPTGAPTAPELVSRTVQSTAGLATGTLVFAVALGGLFGLVYALAQGRLGSLSTRGTALLVAAGGFLALYLLPAVKYPPNPPGTSNATTITDRTQWYGVMLFISVVVVVAGTVLARWLSARLGAWNAALLAAFGGLVVIVVAYAVLPVIDETPKGFAGNVLWQFRVASTAIQLTVWTTLGLVFGALTERQFRTHNMHTTTPVPRSTSTRASPP